ncbi:MAG: hypothetical protein HUU15_07910 [Candidatus Brocadiae bacterium]|nr:hypothetical protein [Candidatus Brocadiia bacterium]
MQRGSVATGLLWAAVAAMIGMNVILCLRVVKLQDAVDRVEARPAPPAGGAGDAPAEGDPAAAARKPAGAEGTTAGATGAMSPKSAGHAADSGSTETVARDVSGRAERKLEKSFTEKDVEALIEKKLAERDKKNPLASILNFEDPMVVMERELKLSDLQKTRIAQHRKERDEAMMDLWQSEEGRQNWRDNQKKMEELTRTCDESIRRELTLDQQEKYESLKKSGKLLDFGGGGASVVIDRAIELPAPETPGK